jgi:hypothetical protein
VRKKLKDFIDYEKNPRFSKALDEICENVVGKTMFKVLMTKMMLQDKRMRICEHSNPEVGSCYEDNIVYINLSFYEISGVGIPDRQYYYVDEENGIKMKPKSLAGSIFHEFCHGLHDISDTYMKKENDTICLDETILGSIWTADEELCTVTCFNNDPICDHCFDFCQSILKKYTFYPRYTHGGWNGGDDSAIRSYLLRYLPLSQKYMDGWREYMV